MGVGCCKKLLKALGIAKSAKHFFSYPPVTGGIAHGRPRKARHATPRASVLEWWRLDAHAAFVFMDMLRASRSVGPAIASFR